MNVLSLFDGISCAQYALQKAGIPVHKYYASEIDQRAIKVTTTNYPKTIQYGSVTKIKAEHFMSKIDLLCGGSPCQGFSFAGKQLNFEDPRSKLFFEFVRLKNELNPKYFFLENVRMVKKSQDIISDMLGVEPVFVNSALVCAQNRKRLYWTNIPGFVMPEDRGIIIDDILESGIGFTRTNGIDKIVKKSNTLDSNYHKGLECNQQRTGVYNVNPSGKGMNGFVHPTGGKMPCLTTNKGEGMKIQAKSSGGKHLTKANTIDAEYGSAGVSASFKQSERRVYNIEDTFRKLTPIECERLQGLPDGYTKSISNSARYHALGNGWQVDTIIEFFKHLPKE